MACLTATEIVYVSDAGPATAYGYAKSKGYTGTEEEFAELLANIGKDLTEIRELNASIKKQIEDLIEDNLDAALTQLDNKRAEAISDLENFKDTTIAEAIQEVNERLEAAQQVETAVRELHSEVTENTEEVRSLKTDVEQIKCDTLEAKAAAIDAKVTAEVAAESAHNSADQAALSKNAAAASALEAKQHADDAQEALTTLEDVVSAASQSASQAAASAFEAESYKNQASEIVSQAEKEISSEKNNIVGIINTAKIDINDLKNSAAQEINNTKDPILAEINEKKTAALASVTGEGTAQKNLVIQEGNTQIGLIQQLVSDSEQAIEDKTDEQLERIPATDTIISEINASAQAATQSITSLQASALETIGTNVQLGNESITTASSSAVAAVEAKKTQVLAEIPDDYTELGSRVTQLSNDIEGIESSIYIIEHVIDHIDSKQYEYACGNLYYAGFVLAKEETADAIKPIFIDAVENYSYRVYESTKFTTETDGLTAVTDWVTNLVDDSIPIKDFHSTDEYKICILLRCSSKIGVGSNKNHPSIGFVYMQTSGYTNYYNANLSPLCDVYSSNKLRKFATKEEVVEKNQGTENVGNLLVVDEDGEVVPRKLNIEVTTDSSLSKIGIPADSKSVGDVVYNTEEVIDVMNVETNQYSCGSPYTSGIWFGSDDYIKTITPHFVDEIETYQYKIVEFPDLIWSVQDVTVIKGWTTLEVNKPIPVEMYPKTNKPYTIVLLKSTSKIAVGSNAVNPNIRFIYTMENGYINYIPTNLSAKCEVVRIKREERLLTKTEYKLLDTGWKDTTIGFIGDSFTALGNWSQELCDNLGATRISKAVSGARFAKQSVASTAYAQAQSFVSNNQSPDAFVIAMGTNDQNSNYEITDIQNLRNTSAITDDILATYTGGIQATLVYLQEHFPNARILLGWTPANGLFVSGGNYKIFMNNMQPYVEKMKEVAGWYGVEYIETRPCGFSKVNDVYHDYWDWGIYQDHPSALGHHKIAQYMTMLMKSLGGFVPVKID